MGFFSAVKKFFGGNEDKNSEEKRVIHEVEEKAANANQTDSVLLSPSPMEEHISKGADASLAHIELSDNKESPKNDILLSEQDKKIEEVLDKCLSEETGPDEVSHNNVHEEAVTEVVEKDEVRLKTETQDEKFRTDSMLVRLRSVEPKLSRWLDIILEDISGPGEQLWERIEFLLRSLDAPRDEIEKFVSGFQKWLGRMEYTHIDEFRSELQYQLALALELEDEEDERSRLFIKLSEGLAKTREQLSRQLDSLFSSSGELDDGFWEEMEELFIMADLGYESAMELTSRLKERARREKVTSRTEIKKLLHDEIEEIFGVPKKIVAVNPPEVILMIGVNGAGKTTTIAKLAHRAKMQGKKVLIAAGDTFRAAAIEQLEVWANRTGVDFFAKAPGSDPAAVAFEAVEKAVRENVDVIFIDTAGRLQTKTNLMQELGKIRHVLAKKHPGAPHRSILVLDATTGQNAISQAKLFKEAANVDELILTKLDGTAKGGVAIAVAMQEHLPITYIGLGEKMDDLRPFNGEDYAVALLGIDNKEAA